MTTCPYCGATGGRVYERGQGAGFVRYRCKDCLAEFDVEAPSNRNKLLADSPADDLEDS